jgi:hypothetical protein
MTIKHKTFQKSSEVGDWGNKIYFVGALLPREAATNHFCFIGATGSGKTVCIRILMQSVLYSRQLNRIISRALVYDAKRDMLPVLHGIVGPDNYKIGHEHKVVTLNPFDTRSYAWDMASDLTAPGHALEMASILIPPDPHASQPFFANAARHLLQGVIIALIRTKKKWTFRDVLYIMKDAERLVAVLANDNETKYIPKLYFGNEKTSNDIMSEIGSRLGVYEIVAALWHKAEGEKRTVSLNQWLKGERDFILVLGNDHTNRVAVDAINQVIFKRVSELILDQNEDKIKKRRAWIILDEFVRAGKLNGIVELATEGRSKGAAVVLGFQDINGARAVYGKEVAEEIIGQCGNIAILRLQSPDTAEWASRLFGSYEHGEEKESQSVGISGTQPQSGTSTHIDIVKREVVLASEFMYFPRTDRQNGLHGRRYSLDVGLMDWTVSGDEIFGKLQANGSISKERNLWPEYEEKPGVVEQGVDYRPVDEQYLKDWTEDDYGRLGLMSLYQKMVINDKRRESEKREADIQELADLIFMQGYPSIEQAKRIHALPTLEQGAFFYKFDEIKKTKMFHGRRPTSEDKKEFDECADGVREVFKRVIRVHQEVAFEKEKRKHVERVAHIQRLAELSFMTGWPTLKQASMISRLSHEEQAAFFHVIENLCQKSLYLGSRPSAKVLSEFNSSSDEHSTDARNIFTRVVDLLKDQSNEHGKGSGDDRLSGTGGRIEEA